jgi:alanyl-tRNA synthetase
VNKITVVSCDKIKSGYKITLENSPLYPDGKGGQLGDRGTISDKNILSVEKDYVIMEDEVLPGEHDIFIDEKRRNDIAVQHTAQHLFSAVAYNDYSLNTVGFRMSDEYSTVDLDSKDITEETIKNIERKVNSLIKISIPVETSIFTKEEIDSMGDMRKAVSDKVKGDVRIVKIGDTDTNACGGFHVENTLEIQLFKIISWEKVKGNYTRFFYISGDRALEDYYQKNSLVNKLCQNLSCKDNEIISMLDKVMTDRKNSESELKVITQKYAELFSKELMETPEIFSGKKIIFYNGDNSIGNLLPKFVDISEYILIFGDSEQLSLTSKLINCKEFFNFFKTKIELRGGGSDTRVSFKGKVSKDLIFQYLEEYLCKL